MLTVITKKQHRKAKAKAQPQRKPLQQLISRIRRRHARDRSAGAAALATVHTTTHSSRPAPTGMLQARQYAACVADPFGNSPVRLGFGCMVPTDLVTCTVRTIISASSAGSAAFLLSPAMSTSLGTYNGGVQYSTATPGAPPAWTQLNWDNITSVQNLYDEARVVAAAIRVLPMVPGTAAPGVAYTASLPSTSYQDIETTTQATLYSSRLFKWGLASSGASAALRPRDPESFTFYHDVVNGAPYADDYHYSAPCIVLSSLPAGVSIQVEAVMHLECIRKFTGASTNAGTGQEILVQSQIPQVFPSVEALWNYVSPQLPQPTSVNGGADLSNRLQRQDPTQWIPPRSGLSGVIGALQP